MERYERWRMVFSNGPGPRIRPKDPTLSIRGHAGGDVTDDWSRRCVIRLLGAALALSGCTQREREAPTVTPAPIPTTETPGRDSSADLVVRNESPYRRSVVLTTLRGQTVLFERSVTVLGGRGERFADVITRGTGTSDTADDLRITVSRTTGEKLGATDVQTTGLDTVILTLLPDAVEWEIVGTAYQ